MGVLAISQIFSQIAAADEVASSTIASAISRVSPESSEGSSIKTFPTNGAIDVPLDAKLSVQAPKAFDETSLRPGVVTLLGPTDATPIDAEFSDDRKRIIVRPRTELRPAAHYTLFVKGTKSLSGEEVPMVTVGFLTTSLSGNESVGKAVANDKQLDRSAEITSTVEKTKLWTPQAINLKGDWRVHKGNSTYQMLSPLAGRQGDTALAGQVLFMNGSPAANVTVKIGDRQTLTDRTGRFLVSSSNGGLQTLVIDGRSANRPGRTFGYFEVLVNLVAGRTTTLPFTSWMPVIDTKHSVRFPSPTTEEIVVKTPYIPGLQVRIPAGTVLRDREGHVINELSITPIPVDRPPFPLPTQYVPVYFTVQPGGAHLEGINAASAQGARVIYPNYRHDPPGSVLDFWNYDPSEKGWYVYGQGKISPNGEQIVPNLGVAIYELTGAMVSVPANAPAIGPSPGGCTGGGGSPGAGGTPGPASPDESCTPAPPTPDQPAESGGGGAGGGCGSQGGDPVDCATGLFMHARTDLSIPGIIPLELTRVYRQSDNTVRAFGVGTNDRYDIFTIGDIYPWTYQDLILPDGGRIHFPRTSPGTGYIDAVYTHTSSPSAYYGAAISWTGSNWVLKMKDGRKMYFAECTGCSSARKAAMTAFDDRLGNHLSLTRDTYGNLTRITSPDGRYINLSYDSGNRITQAVDNIGRVVGYQYDSQGRLASVTDPDGGIERYTYDSLNNMLTVVRPNGQTMVTNVYDENNRVSKQTLADGGIYQFAYALDTSGKVTKTTITDPNGNVRIMSFNANGYSTGGTWGFGKPEAQTFSYDRDQASNLLLSSTDALGRKTSYTYDVKGNMTSRTLLSGTAQALTSTFTYDPTFNRLSTFTDPLGHTLSYLYDPVGNRIGVTDALNRSSTYTFNHVGQRLTSTDPLGHTTSYQYLGADLISVVDPLGRAFTRYLDAIGRPLSIVDSVGNRTLFRFNARGLLTQAADAQGGAIHATYDANGNLMSFTDARGSVTQFTYDAKDRLASRTDPLQATESYTYDGNNNLIRYVDRIGKVATYTYDALNRGIAAKYGQTLVGGNLTEPDASVNSTYDYGDRLTQIVDTASGSISRSYDGLDRLLSETTPTGIVSYGYDAAGRRVTFQVGGQPSLSYGYDDANQLLAIIQGNSKVAFTYDAAGRPKTLTMPNGIVKTYEFSAADEVTSIGYIKGSTVIGALSYTYNPNGQRVEANGSLATTLIPAGMSGATYDAANRLVNWAGSTKTYDANGNLASDGTSTYQWDSRERLTSIGGSVNGSFSYDSSGRRVAKTINGSTTNFVYDGENFVQELAAGSASATRLTGLLIDQFFTRTDSLGARIAITDALGSTLALVDENGLTKTTYSYEPYGGASTAGESNANSTQYAGRENDGSGLYYYRNRYYSPQTSRFISEDSIDRTNGSVNAYAYVRGNPLSFIDPLGLYDIEPGLQPVCPECALIPIARAGRVIADLWPRQKEPQACPGADKQFGKKFGEHKDPDLPGYRNSKEYRDLANDIYNDSNATRTTYPKGAPKYSGETHVQSGNNLLRLDSSGNFRSLYPIGNP